MDLNLTNLNHSNGPLITPGLSSNHTNMGASSIPAEILSVKIIKFVLYAAVFIVGFGGNCIVIWIMMKKNKARNFHNLLLCNLAAADIALLSINLPFRLVYQEYNYVWPFGKFLCKIIPMFTYLFLTASSLTLVAISYERHRKISSLTVQNKPITQWDKLTIAILWVVSCLMTLPLNLYLDVIDGKAGQPVCTDVWPSPVLEGSYFLFLFIVQFLLPTVVMIVMYFRVGLILRNARSNMNAFGLENLTKRYRKTIRLICTIVIVYILLTLPYHITWQLNTFGIKNDLVKKFSVLFLTATSASHPIIYGTLHQEFSHGFKAFLCCSKKAREEFLRESVKFRTIQNRRHSCVVEETTGNNNVSVAESVQRVSVV